MCSPSPCESIATLTDDEQGDELQAAAGAGQEDEDRHSIESPKSVATTPINESREKLFPMAGTSGCATPTPQHLFNENFDEFSGSQSTAQQQRSMKSYLHTFDRRNSDTTYLLGRRSSGERVNLADEIRKLSDHLLMLAEINTKLGDGNNNSSSSKEEAAKESKATKMESSSSSSVTQTQEGPKWTSTTRSSSSTSRVTPRGLLNSTSSTTSSSSQIQSSNKAGQQQQQKVSSSLSVRLQQSIEETPKLSNGSADNWLKSQQQSQVNRSVKSTVNTISTSNTQSSTHVVQSSSSKITSSSSSSHNHVLSESASSRRAKFRINQMSRDVPIGLPDTHQTVNLEEAANTTKDCLLHLLEKYNETKNRNPVGRHQSISVCDWHVSDNLEYRSMSSINAFFQRHGNTSSAGQNVRHIQAQLEEKATGK